MGLGYFFFLPASLIEIIIYFFFLRTIRDLLWAVSEQNRKMVPAAVWLNWIPVFSWGWMFVTIVKVRESAQAEIAWKGLRGDGALGFGVGMTSATLFILGQVVVPIALWGDRIAGTPMEIVYLLTLVGFLACMLVYWMRISELQGLLAGAAPAPGSPANSESIEYKPQSWQRAPEAEPPVPTGPPLGVEAAAVSGAAEAITVAEPPPRAEPVTMPVVARSTPTGEGSTGTGSTGSEAAGTVGPARVSPGQPPVVPPAVCPSCGTAGHHVGGFCRSCGSPVVAVWPTIAESQADEPGDESPATLSAGSCPFCGAPYRPGGKFCSSCGRPAG